MTGRFKDHFCLCFYNFTPLLLQLYTILLGILCFYYPDTLLEREKKLLADLWDSFLSLFFFNSGLGAFINGLHYHSIFSLVPHALLKVAASEAWVQRGSQTERKVRDVVPLQQLMGIRALWPHLFLKKSLLNLDTCGSDSLLFSDLYCIACSIGLLSVCGRACVQCLNLPCMPDMEPCEKVFLH